MIHIEIDEPYRKKAFKTSTSIFQSSNKSQAPNQKMRIAVAALILVFLLSTTICKGEENRDQEAEEADFPATKNFYLWLLQVLGTYLSTFEYFCQLFWDGLYGSYCSWDGFMRCWEDIAPYNDEFGPIESFCIIQDLS